MDAADLRNAFASLGPEEFSCRLAEWVPYTETIRAEVLDFEPGRVTVRMEDRPELRNHLDSLHAVALMNLGELASGLSLMAVLPEGARAILVHLEMDYEKKARGTLTASAAYDPGAGAPEGEIELEAVLRDASGERVATARARWLAERAEG